MLYFAVTCESLLNLTGKFGPWEGISLQKTDRHLKSLRALGNRL